MVAHYAETRSSHSCSPGLANLITGMEILQQGHPDCKHFEEANNALRAFDYDASFAGRSTAPGDERDKASKARTQQFKDECSYFLKRGVRDMRSCRARSTLASLVTGEDPSSARADGSIWIWGDATTSLDHPPPVLWMSSDPYSGSS